MTTTQTLQLCFILGCVFVAWVAISTWRQKKRQLEMQQRNARERREAEERKAKREQGRELRANVRDWETEFLTLDATQFFNPRKGGRVANLNLKRHDYRAKIEQYTSQDGKICRKLVVNDLQGRQAEVNILTDAPDSSEYLDCVISDTTGQIIGGWQLAHEEIPYEFMAASINIGYFYRDPLELPTTVPIGYIPNPPPGGWITLIRYRIPMGESEREFHEAYLEDHFSEVFPNGAPGWQARIRKVAARIHVCPAAEPVVEMTPEQQAAEVSRANEEFRRKNAELFRGIPPNQSLVEWAIESVQLKKNVPPPPVQSSSTTSASEQEAWIRRRVELLKKQSEKNAGASHQEGVARNLDALAYNGEFLELLCSRMNHALGNRDERAAYGFMEAARAMSGAIFSPDDFAAINRASILVEADLQNGLWENAIKSGQHFTDAIRCVVQRANIRN